jgi:hypothetical protein
MILTAEHLAMQPEGCVLEWSLYDDWIIADGYRIHYIDSNLWELTYRGGFVAIDRTISAAFLSAEQHAKEVDRRRDRRRYVIALVAALLGWFAVDAAVQVTDVVWFLAFLIPIVWVGFRAAAGFLTTLGGDLTGRYGTIRR